MPLKVTRIREDLFAVFAGEPPELSVDCLVPEEVWPPGKALWAVVARILRRLVTVTLHHVVVQPEKGRENTLR